MVCAIRNRPLEKWGGGGVGHFADQCAGFFKPFGVQEFFFALHEPLQVHLLCLNYVLFFTYHPPPPPSLF